MTIEEIKELQTDYYNRIIPDPQWPTMWKDHEAILYLCHKNKCKSFFEIGTWEGFTGRIVWESGIKDVSAIDINLDLGLPYHHNHHPQSNMERIGKYLQEVGIEIDFADSRNYKPKRSYDAVFIDADHSHHHTVADTLLALSMRPKLILWHDYGNGHYGVDKALTEFKWLNPKLFDIKVYPESVVAYVELR